MPKFSYKKNNAYEGVVSYVDVKYTEQELIKMTEEFVAAEKKLAKSYKPYSSEYSYELGLILNEKLEKYKIVESERYGFWKTLREYVNKLDKRKTITELRDAYEYCYLLSKLPRELVEKYSRSKWDHLFDVSTARKDERLYNWLLKVDSEELKGSNRVFQDFCKGLKVYMKDIDTGVLEEAEVEQLFSESLEKSIFLTRYQQNNKINFKINTRKIHSTHRDKFFRDTKGINEQEKLEKTLDKIINN